MDFKKVIERDELEYLAFKDFWPIFCESLAKDDDARQAFYFLLDKGVTLRYNRLGYVYDDLFASNGDVKAMLSKIYRHGSTMDNEIVRFADGLDATFGQLLIKRSDVEQVYLGFGHNQYPWATAKSQPETVRGDGTPSNKKTKTKRTTKLNDWLREKWDGWGKPNAKDFAAKLKPFQGAHGSPVKKYYGWLPAPNIILEWQPGWGSTTNSWTLRTFENKVDDFKRDDKNTENK